MQTVTSAQANAEVPINENFTTLSWAECYGKKATTTTGLTWGYWGGQWAGFTVSDGTLSLTANTTNYIYVVKSTGVITVSTNIASWNDALNAKVYLVVTGALTVTSVTDYRGGPGGVHGATALTGNVNTNLSTSYTSNSVVVNSDTGNDATISAADSTAAGVMSSADKVKLDGLSMDRSNHTGTQLASTISDFSEAVDAVLVQGSNITLNYNAGADTITISSSGGVSLTSSVQPSALGVQSIGTSNEAARADHIHPESSVGLRNITASIPGTLQSLVGTLRYYPSSNITINNVIVSVGTAPTGSAIFNVRKNGVAIFSSPKPTITVGNYRSTPINPNISVTTSDYLTIDVETASGSDATIRIDY